MAARHLTIDDQENALTSPLLLPVALKGVGRGAAQDLTIQPVPWQSNFGSTKFRIPLHPWTGGVHTDRFHDGTTYAISQADLTNDSLMVPWALQNALTLTNTTDPPIKMVNFGGELFILTGPDVYRIQTNYTVTRSKDLATDYSANGTDMVVFNGELIVALGESTKIAKLDGVAGTWSQASDNVFAVNLAVVGNLLWRSHDTCQVDSCATTPLTLANWTTANYPVGDGTYTTIAMIEYGGVLWVRKQDGVYEGNDKGEFKNQVPQLKRLPRSADLAAMWTAFGYLWVGGKHFLYKVRHGESIPVYPETAHRHAIRPDVSAGIEVNGVMFVLSNPGIPSEGSPLLWMMLPSNRVHTGAPAGHEFIFHALDVLTTEARAIGFLPGATLPSLIVGSADNAVYYKLARAGRNIEDSSYAFSTALTYWSSPFTPSQDMGVEATIVGVDVVLFVSSDNANLTLDLDVVNNEAGAEALDSTNTTMVPSSYSQDAWDTYTFYTSTQPFKGRLFEVYLEWANTGSAWTYESVPRIREMWAWGYMHPRQTDEISVTVYAGNQVVQSAVDLNSVSNLETKLAFWKDQGTLLTVTIPGYNDDGSFGAILTDWKVAHVNTDIGPGEMPQSNDLLRLTFTRVDYDGTYGT